jgi:YjbE family integral membrane protein
MAVVASPDFWLALLQITLINIVLSGDNAVVIALACRSLPARQQKKAILFGSIGAIVLRVVLTFFAVYLLNLPGVKLVGAALLLWIGVDLLSGEDDKEHVQGKPGLVAAIKTIVIADVVMSLDNVVAVAAAARNDLLLLVLGLVIGIPLIVFGSTLLLKLMNRFPIIVTLGAGLLGWVAGDMALSDPAIEDHVEPIAWLHVAAPAVGAVAVVAVGKWLGSRRRGAERQRSAADEAAG